MATPFFVYSKFGISEYQAPLCSRRLKLCETMCATKRGGEGVVPYSEPSIGGASEVSCNFNGESRGERDF